MQWQFMGDYSNQAASMLPGGLWSQILYFLAANITILLHLFIFATGVGLAMSAGRKETWWQFQSRRLSKVLPPMWISVIAFSVFAPLAGSYLDVGRTVRKLLFINIFTPGEFFSINAPTWYIFLALQLYLLFRPLRAFVLRYQWKALAVLLPLSALARYLLSVPAIAEINPYIAHACGLNWMFVMGVGILIGDHIRTNEQLLIPPAQLAVAFVLSASVVALAYEHRLIYMFNDSAAGVAVPIAVWCVWRAVWRWKVVPKVLVALGVISFPIFLYHRPIVAKVVGFWQRHEGSIPPPWLYVALFVAIYACVWAGSRLLERRPGLKKLVFGG